MRRVGRLRAGLVGLALLVAFAPPVAAGPKPKAGARARPEARDARNRVIARGHFVRAEKLFALGRFAEALVEYEKSFELAPLPEILLNIAQAHRNLDQLDEAVFGYRKYLQLDPTSRRRADIEQLIAELEAESARRVEAARAAEQARVAEAARAEAETRARIDASLAPQPARPPARPVYRRWWFIAGAAVAATAATGAVIVLTRDDLPDSDLGVVDFRR